MNDLSRPWLKHYDSGVPASIDLPEISLVELLQQTARKYPKETCIVYRNRRLTYAAVDTQSDRLAAWLVSRGLQPGDRVGLLLPNTPEFVIGFYAILKAGGIVMALNPAYQAGEIRSLSKESGIRFLVLASGSYAMVKEALSGTTLENLVVIGGEEIYLEKGDVPWKTIITKASGVEASLPDVSPDDPAIFQYSGGTTGTPKCAVGLHRNLVANVIQFDHWLVNTVPGKERILVAIPMYHVYGMVLGMNLAVKMGAQMILVDNPRDLDGLLQTAQRHQATIFPGVPNLYAAINHYPPVQEGKYDLSSIKACISGSATLPRPVKAAFEGLTHGHLVEGYGLSEAPTATHCNPILGENRTGSIGLPLPGVDCRIVDLDTGIQDVPSGEVGELIIRGPQVMAGYHQRPQETRIALREGWLYTGDVARMDEDGFFYLVDRKKDVIKVGGFQVWPNEIEAVLLQHKKVREAAVAGVRDESGNEVAKAWLVPQEGEVPSLDEIKAFCRKHLVGYKVPKYIAFQQTLPKTGVGKVLRRVLVQSHQDAS